MELFQALCPIANTHSKTYTLGIMRTVLACLIAFNLDSSFESDPAATPTHPRSPRLEGTRNLLE
jgi:hypothetical protein